MFNRLEKENCIQVSARQGAWFRQRGFLGIFAGDCIGRCNAYRCYVGYGWFS